MLYPHRSLAGPDSGLILAIVAAVGITIGGFFVLQGAWPIFGFYGLDLLLVWWPCVSSYRAGRRYEKVRLTDRELVIERVDPRGRREVLSLQPHWLDVAMDDPPEHESR